MGEVRRGRPSKPQTAGRVGLYIMPETRRRLNIFKALIGADNQDAAIDAALDAAGAPTVPEAAPTPAAVRE